MESMESETFEFLSGSYSSRQTQTIVVENIFFICWQSSLTELQYWIVLQRCSSYLTVDFQQDISCFFLHKSEINGNGSTNSSVNTIVGLSNGDIYNIEIFEEFQQFNRTPKWKLFLENSTIEKEIQKYYVYKKELIYKSLEVRAITKVANQIIFSNHSNLLVNLNKRLELPYTMEYQFKFGDENYMITSIKSFPADLTGQSFYDYLITLFGVTANHNDFNYIILLLCDNGTLLWYTLNTNNNDGSSNNVTLDQEDTNSNSNNNIINNDTINTFVRLNSSIISIFSCTLPNISSAAIYPHLLCVLEVNLTLSCYSVFKSWYGTQIHENKLKFPNFAYNIAIWRKNSFLFLLLQELYITHLYINPKGKLQLSYAYKLSESYTCPIHSFSLYDNFLILSLCNGKLTLFEIPVIENITENTAIYSNQIEINKMFKSIFRSDAIKNTASSTNNNNNDIKNDNSSNCNTSSKDIDDIKNLQLQLNQQNVDDHNLESKIACLDQEILALTSLIHLLQQKQESPQPPPDALPVLPTLPQKIHLSHPFPALSSLHVTAIINASSLPPTYIPQIDQKFPPHITSQTYQLTVTLTTNNWSMVLAIQHRILQILWRCTLPSTSFDPTLRVITIPIIMSLDTNTQHNNCYTFTTALPVAITRLAPHRLELSINISFLVPEVIPIPSPPCCSTSNTSSNHHDQELAALPSSVNMTLFSKDWNILDILAISNVGKGLGGLSTPILSNHSSNSSNLSTSLTAAAVAAKIDHTLNIHIPTPLPAHDNKSSSPSTTTTTIPSTTTSAIIDSLHKFSNNLTHTFASNATNNYPDSISSLISTGNTTRFHQNLSLTVRESNSSKTIASSLDSTMSIISNSNNNNNINRLQQSVIIRSNNKEILPLLHAATREESLHALFNSNNNSITNSNSDSDLRYNPSDVYSMPPQLRKLMEELDNVIQIFEYILTKRRLKNAMVKNNDSHLDKNNNINNNQDKNKNDKSSQKDINLNAKERISTYIKSMNNEPIGEVLQNRAPKARKENDEDVVVDDDDRDLELATNNLWEIYLKFREYGS